jgi:hypothetical protein
MRLGRVVLAAVGALLFADWYARRGREFLLGPRYELEDREGLELLDRWVRVRPPGLKRTFTDTACVRMTGVTVELDGDVIGEIVEAKRLERGLARVHYRVQRQGLGWPITSAVARADMLVSEVAARFAVEMTV